MFGGDHRVQRDMFHVTKNIMKHCAKKHPLYNTFAGRLSSSFFARDEDSYCKLRDHLRQAGLPEHHVEAVMKSPEFSRKAGVLRQLKPRGMMKADVEEVFEEFFGTALFHGTMVKEKETVLALIDEGYLEELEGVKVFYTNPQTGQVLTRRGTGVCEKYHNEIRALNLARFNPKTANAMLIRCGYRHSHSAGIRVLGEILSPNLTDPLLMNEYARVYAACSSVVKFNNPIASFVHLDKAPKEDWFSGFHYENPESAVGVALRIIGGEDGVVSDSVLKRLVIPQKYEFISLFERLTPIIPTVSRLCLSLAQPRGFKLKKRKSFFGPFYEYRGLSN